MKLGINSVWSNNNGGNFAHVKFFARWNKHSFAIDLCARSALKPKNSELNLIRADPLEPTTVVSSARMGGQPTPEPDVYSAVKRMPILGIDEHAVLDLQWKLCAGIMTARCAHRQGRLELPLLSTRSVAKASGCGPGGFVSCSIAMPPPAPQP